MSKLRLKVREVEIEIEDDGNKPFEKLEAVLSKVVQLYKDTGGIEAPKNILLKAPPVVSNSVPNGPHEMTFNSFVAVVGGESCRDLLKASAAYLVLIGSQEKFRDEDLITTARDSNRWKKDYGVNVRRDITRMVQQSDLIENAHHVYSLPPAIAEQMKSKVAALNG